LWKSPAVRPEIFSQPARNTILMVDNNGQNSLAVTGPQGTQNGGKTGIGNWELGTGKRTFEAADSRTNFTERYGIEECFLK
jgi:hypothetical protein